ncbi:chromatin accessibility complex protein 1 isoform X2 [Gopherus evgoodei]|uniref:chromatin accessibility complex protein 1 isoform X2 n=1 Tax=Gopherus evgoodei TaxID=1825980 RepID=UPI0011D0201D|nr:chromatin accessibility complex protein 1 isoform X2 [Gopherus evgoodei]
MGWARVQARFVLFVLCPCPRGARHVQGAHTLLQELFVQYLATYSYKHGRGKEKRALTYSDLSHTAEESETFQFLADILPKKILASKYLKMLEREKRDGEMEEEEEDDDDDDDDQEEESEEEDAES